MQTLVVEHMSDEQLVAQYQATGDNCFFGEIYTRHYKKVYHTCLKIVKDRDIAADLVQEVMIKVIEKLPLLKNSFLLGFWMYRIAQNQSIDYCKAQKNYRTVSISESINTAEAATDLTELQKKELCLDSLESMLQQLKDSDRELLYRKYFKNKTVEDLGLEYQVSESAIKMRLSRARTRLVGLCLEEPVFIDYRLKG